MISVLQYPDNEIFPENCEWLPVENKKVDEMILAENCKSEKWIHNNAYLYDEDKIADQ